MGYPNATILVTVVVVVTVIVTSARRAQALGLGTGPGPSSGSGFARRLMAKLDDYAPLPGESEHDRCERLHQENVARSQRAMAEEAAREEAAKEKDAQAAPKSRPGNNELPPDKANKDSKCKRRASRSRSPRRKKEIPDDLSAPDDEQMAKKKESRRELSRHADIMRYDARSKVRPRHYDQQRKDGHSENEAKHFSQSGATSKTAPSVPRHARRGCGEGGTTRDARRSPTTSRGRRSRRKPSAPRSRRSPSRRSGDRDRDRRRRSKSQKSSRRQRRTPRRESQRDRSCGRRGSQGPQDSRHESAREAQVPEPERWSHAFLDKATHPESRVPTSEHRSPALLAKKGQPSKEGEGDATHDEQTQQKEKYKDQREEMFRKALGKLRARLNLKKEKRNHDGDKISLHSTVTKHRDLEVPGGRPTEKRSPKKDVLQEDDHAQDEPPPEKSAVKKRRDAISLHSRKSARSEARKWHMIPALRRKGQTGGYKASLGSASGTLLPWRQPQPSHPSKKSRKGMKGPKALTVASDTSAINPSKFLIAQARDQSEKHLKARIRQEVLQTELAEMRASNAEAEIQELKRQQQLSEGAEASQESQEDSESEEASQESQEDSESEESSESEDQKLEERVSMLRAPLSASGITTHSFGGRTLRGAQPPPRR